MRPTSAGGQPWNVLSVAVRDTRVEKSSDRKRANSSGISRRRRSTTAVASIIDARNVLTRPLEMPARSYPTLMSKTVSVAPGANGMRPLATSISMSIDAFTYSSIDSSIVSSCDHSTL
jgi:hypothetical protein